MSSSDCVASAMAEAFSATRIRPCRSLASIYSAPSWPRNLDITALRFEGRDHGFRKADNMSGFRDVFGKDATWFLKTNSPIGEIRLDEIFSIA